MRIFNTLHSFSIMLFLWQFAMHSYAQTLILGSSQSINAQNHFVYIGTDGKMGCTTSETVINEAMNTNPDNINIFSSEIHNSVLSPEQTLTVTSANFSITYTGFTPAAQAAFQAAVGIWASLISSPVQIRINAMFTPMSGSILGFAGPNGFWALGDGTTYRFYPDALADAVQGYDLSPNNPDINSTFNSSFNFYFGTDGNCPSNQIDFESVVLHELDHGLGFIGSGRIGSSSNQSPCTSDVNLGCYGFNAGKIYPTIFDAFVKNNVNNAIANNLTDTLTYINPSANIKSLLTSGNLYFQSSSIRNHNGGNGAQLYAPSTFAVGSTFSHLDEATYPPTSGNALMTPSFSYGETEHFPGVLGCAIMGNMGWQVAGACLSALPVELTTFTAQNKDAFNVLIWQTASEINNSHFEIQRSVDGQKFEIIGEVKGIGTSNNLENYSFTDNYPFDGINYYRLRQVDNDGKAMISNVVSVLNGKQKNSFSVQTNVAQSEIFINASASKNVDTPFEIVDMLGRTMLSEVFKNNQTLLKINIESFSAGQYLIHFFSEAAALRFVKL